MVYLLLCLDLLNRIWRIFSVILGSSIGERFTEYIIGIHGDDGISLKPRKKGTTLGFKSTICDSNGIALFGWISGEFSLALALLEPLHCTLDSCASEFSLPCSFR